MNQEEIAENFRDITAGIQKLRMDSSADDLISRKVVQNAWNTVVVESAVAYTTMHRPHAKSPINLTCRLINPTHVIGFCVCFIHALYAVHICAV